MRPIRILAALAIAALVACNSSPAPQRGFGGFTGGGFTPPGGGLSWGSGGFAGGGGFVPFPWFYLDASIDAPSGTTMSVAITDSADPVITGADAYSYSVVLTNTGAVNATTVSVATTLDASLTYVSASGTGWSCGQAAGVVTCTAASIAVGAAPAITISVTTGTSAVSASSSVVASASNASNATASQGTTVQLVSKDATAGIYMPASSTEWTNFIARKGLTVPVPTSLYLCQEASGNLTDSIGGFTATAAGTPLYQQAITGWSRTGVGFTEGNTTQQFSSTATANIATNSWFRLALVKVAATTTSTKNMFLLGTTTLIGMGVQTTGKFQVVFNTNTTASANTYSGAVMFGMEFDRTNSRGMAYTQTEKVTGTYNSAPTGQKMTIGVGSNTNGPFTFGYVADWSGTNAVLTDAQIKALYQAMGYSIPWS